MQFYFGPIDKNLYSYQCCWPLLASKCVCSWQFPVWFYYRGILQTLHTLIPLLFIFSYANTTEQHSNINYIITHIWYHNHLLLFLFHAKGVYCASWPLVQTNREERAVFMSVLKNIWWFCTIWRFFLFCFLTWSCSQSCLGTLSGFLFCSLTYSSGAGLAYWEGS